MRKSIWVAISLSLIIIIACACAIERPIAKFEDKTLINWGIKGCSDKGIVVLPFETGRYDRKWGVYSARKMKEYLLEHGAFKRVILSDSPAAHVSFVLRGKIDYMWYGGSYTPSEVSLTVRIIGTSDGKTRYLKKTSTTYERRGFDMSEMSRLYLSSPIPEQLLDALLRHVAKDVAATSTLPAE